MGRLSRRRDSILIVGSGAMACLFGARLAPHAEVTLLGTWPEGLAALRREGIRLEADGRSTVAAVRVATDPAECAGARHALVLVKSWQTPRAAEMLEACLAPDGVALTLQNGLGNLIWLRERLGESRAVQGVTTCGATLLEPGHVRAGGDGPTYLAGKPAVASMAALLTQAGFPVERVDDVQALAWGKAVVNAAINPITALLRVPNGELLNPARSGAWALAAEAANEAARVAAACGVRLAFGDPATQVAEVARRTASNRSSMLQDVERGRPTEIDAINGMVVTEGDRLGVATPVNRVLWGLVRSAGRGAQGEAG
jgi:2-dehydropantoate 2-reductase